MTGNKGISWQILNFIAPKTISWRKIHDFMPPKIFHDGKKVHFSDAGDHRAHFTRSACMLLLLDCLIAGISSILWRSWFAFWTRFKQRQIVLSTFPEELERCEFIPKVDLFSVMKIFWRHEIMNFPSWKCFLRHEIQNPSWNAFIPRHGFFFSRHEIKLPSWNNSPSWITLRRHEIHYFPSWNFVPSVMNSYLSSWVQLFGP